MWMKKQMLNLLALVTLLFVCCFSSAYADNFKNQAIEQSYALFGSRGNYSEWILNDKLNWLEILLPISSSEDKAQILDLYASKEETLIDAYLSRRFYVEGHPEAISIYYLLREIWGDEFGWTLDQRAQQTIWIEKYLPNEIWDTYHYRIPSLTVIQPEEALDIAKTTLQDAGLIGSEDNLEISIRYGVHRKQLAEMPCHYVVDFRELRIVDGEEKMVPTFSCYITNEGEVMDSSYNRNIAYYEIQPSPFPQLPYQPFSSWSLEEKAAFSDRFFSQMPEYMEEYPNYRGVYYYATRCSYGLPDEDSIDQERAEKVARNAVLSIGADEEYLVRAGTRFFFDVTAAEQPLWKVYFSTLFSENTRYGDSIGYFVIIDAQTGTVIDKYEHVENTKYEMFY